MLESHWFSKAYSIQHDVEGIRWASISPSWDTHHVSHRVRWKNIFVDVEVVDAPLEYNLLLGHSWFYDMMAVASSVFRFFISPIRYIS
jgi:hypothetical protein